MCLELSLVWDVQTIHCGMDFIVDFAPSVVKVAHPYCKE